MFFSKNINKTIVLFKDILSKLIIIYILAHINTIVLAQEINDIQYTPLKSNIKELIRNNSLDSAFLEPKIEFLNKINEISALKTFRKKFSILYFYSMWCTICHKEMKILDTFAEQLKFQDVEDVIIIPICEDYSSIDKIQEFYQHLKIKNLSIYADESKRSFTLLKVNSLPSTYFVNKEGYIIFKNDSVINWEDKEFIDKIIEIKNISISELNNIDKNNYENNSDKDIIQSKPEVSKTIIIK